MDFRLVVKGLVLGMDKTLHLDKIVSGKKEIDSVSNMKWIEDCI